MSDDGYKARSQILVDYLADRDVPCPGPCGHPLRGYRGPKCPKCGRDLWIILGLVRPMPVSIADYLAVEHMPCPGCRYDLHGVRTNRCPECGREVSLVDLQGQHRPTMPSSFALASTGLMVAGLVSGVLLMRSTIWPYGPTFELFVAITETAGAIGGIILLSVRARRFATLAREHRAGIALLCWALPVLYLCSCFFFP